MQCSELQGEQDKCDTVILEEGDYRIGCLRKRWKRKITYLRGEKKLLSLHSKHFFDYYILKEPGEEGKVSSAYSYVLWEYIGRDEECVNDTGKNRTITLKSKKILGWYFVFIFILIILFLAIGEGKGILASLCFCFTFRMWGYQGLQNLYYRLNVRTWRLRRLSSHGVSELFLKQSPGFCLEKLISGLNSKLLQLIYAETTEEVGNLVSCDMAQFLKEHADVVNCEINNFWFVSLTSDYRYLNVAYRVELEKDRGWWIRRKKETILLQLARPTHGIMESDLYHDWSIIKMETRKK
jgi:hypothetical protein